MKRSNYNDNELNEKLNNEIFQQYSLYNDNIVDVDITFSTLSQPELLNLSQNDNLNENSLIFSCFDYKNTIDNLNQKLSGYPYRQNNLFFINNEQYIFPLNYNILNKESHFDFNKENKISTKIDNKSFIYDNNNKYIIPIIDNLQKSTATLNGLFKINNENLLIDENEYLNLIYDYQYILNNFSDILTNINSFINNSSEKLQNSLRYIKKTVTNQSNKNKILGLIDLKYVTINKDKNLIYKDDKVQVEINNFSDYFETNYYYFPQYYIDNDIDNFIIIVPFVFKYTSTYGISNYMGFINSLNILSSDGISIYKVNEKKFENLNNNFHTNAFNNINITDIFDESLKNNLLTLNYNKSYIFDFEITNSEFDGSFNVFEGSFNIALNFSVNYKSNFDLCKILIKFNTINKNSESEELILPLMLRFCNNKSKIININDSLFYDINEGFNFNNHGNLVGKCCIPEKFFSKNNSKISSKPIFITPNKYKIEYDLFDNPKDLYNLSIFKLKYNNSQLLLNQENGVLTTYQENISLVPLKCYYINKLFRNSNQTYNFTTGNITQAVHYIKNIYKQNNQSQSNNYIEVENFSSSIYDYELEVLKDNEYNLGESLYFKEINNSSIFNNFLSNKTFLNQIYNPKNKSFNQLCFPQIYDIYGNGLNKGDYYLPSILEYYAIKNINNMNNNYFLLTSCHISESNTYKLIGDINNENNCLYDIDNLPPTNVIFKIPDYTLLTSDNYHMYFDKENNYYIIDYLGNYSGAGFLGFNIKKNYSNINKLFIKDKNNNDVIVDSLNIKIEDDLLEKNKINIRCNLSEFFVCYVDSDPDMNIINNDYRILFKVFIKK